MKVLIACEYSGIVRDAFLAKGHDALSCDLLPTDSPGPHYQGSVEDILNDGWDLMIAHPPCTHLAVSGARWFKDKQEEQKEALNFVRLLLDAPINKIALENPVSIIPAASANPTKSSNRGNTAIPTAKRPACGSKTFPTSPQPTFCPSPTTEFGKIKPLAAKTSSAPAKTAGRSAAKLTKESLARWHNNGAKQLPAKLINEQ